MLGKVINYFTDGNTAKGFRSFLKSNIYGMDKVYVLNGSFRTSKAMIIRKVGEEWQRKGYDIELMHCSADSNFINGVIIPELKIGVVDGTDQNDIEPIPSASVVYIDLDVALNEEEIEGRKEEFEELNVEKKKMYEFTYGAFSDALKIHDEWEKIYIGNMNFNKADSVTDTIIETLFADKSSNKEAIVRDRFLGAATPSGSVDFINNLTANINTRYFIKGRPGSGKSTLLKKIVTNAQQRGYNAEVYHCGFDPDSLDMVILRELGISIFDSTSPHEYFPERENDEVIDMYEQAITYGTDDKYSSELQDIVQRYKSKTMEGTSFLQKAKKMNDELERIYASALDLNYIVEIKCRINFDISKIIEENE